eukprot:404763_1
MTNVYGLDIGFHISDNTKQKYLTQHFIPNLNVLHNLRFIILHGCHKVNNSSNKEYIDLFYDTLKNLKNIIYIDLSCFCSKLKRITNVIDDEKKNNNNELNNNKIYSLIFPISV